MRSFSPNYHYYFMIIIIIIIIIITECKGFAVNTYMILERLSMTFTANDKRQDEIFFLPKKGET